MLGLWTRSELFSYLGGIVYGYWENARAMAFDSTGIAGNYDPGQFVRSHEGFQKLLDQNTGDGTIVALGFLGAEVLSKSVDHLAKKAGLKGFDPTIRFLSSVGFGVGLASWLETTTIMNNTIDIPGDLFGVGLGAAAILTTKIIANHATEDNFTQMMDFVGNLYRKVDVSLNGEATSLAENITARVLDDEDVETAMIALSTRIESEISLE